MANYWNIPGVPHKGWSYQTIIDIYDEGEELQSCMMCGKEQIRYVHVLSHPEMNEVFCVGCSCAEKMTDDYINPKERQQQLENRAARKENWKFKDWKQNQKGNYYYKFEDHFLVIFRDKYSNKFKFTIDGVFGTKAYPYLSEVKEAIFKKIEEL